MALIVRWRDWSLAPSEPVGDGWHCPGLNGPYGTAHDAAQRSVDGTDQDHLVGHGCEANRRATEISSNRSRTIPETGSVWSIEGCKADHHGHPRTDQQAPGPGRRRVALR